MEAAIIFKIAIASPPMLATGATLYLRRVKIPSMGLARGEVALLFGTRPMFRVLETACLSNYHFTAKLLETKFTE